MVSLSLPGLARQSIETKDLRVCGARSSGQARGLCSNAERVLACFVSLSFAGLVVLARSLNPIPSRTRPLNSSAPMVLWLKPWESRSLPGLPRTKQFLLRVTNKPKRCKPKRCKPKRCKPKRCKPDAASLGTRRFFVSGVLQPRHFRPGCAAAPAVEFMTRSFQNP